jgi:hypothetical protein
MRTSARQRDLDYRALRPAINLLALPPLLIIPRSIMVRIHNWHSLRQVQTHHSSRTQTLLLANNSIPTTLLEQQPANLKADTVFQGPLTMIHSSKLSITLTKALLTPTLSILAIANRLGHLLPALITTPLRNIPESWRLRQSPSRLLISPVHLHLHHLRPMLQRVQQMVEGQKTIEKTSFASANSTSLP